MRHLGGVWYHELGRQGLGTRSGSLVRTKGAIDDMLDSAPCTLVQLDTSGGYTMQIYQNQSMYMPSTSLNETVRWGSLLFGNHAAAGGTPLKNMPLAAGKNAPYTPLAPHLIECAHPA